MLRRTRTNPSTSQLVRPMESLNKHEIFRGVYVIQVCAFDRKQALDLLKSDFKDDPDIDKVRITRVTSKPLGSGECLYTIFFRLDNQLKSDQPHIKESQYRESLRNPRCPECNGVAQRMGILPTKKGKRRRYRCMACGVTFSGQLNPNL